MAPTEGQSGREDRNPWAERGFLISGVVVALIVVLAIVLVVTGGDGDNGTAQSSPPASDTPSAPSTTTTAPVQSSECGLPAGSQDVPSAGPADTKWELVGSMAAPTAPDRYGPARVEDSFRTCFARSPLGALYAAVNFWAANTAHPGVEVIEHLAANTEVKQQAIADARAGGDAARLDDESKVQVAGFTFLAYDRNTTIVDLVLRAENGGLLRIPTTVRWESGDWKYVIPPNGELGASQIPDLRGYAEWSGA